MSKTTFRILIGTVIILILFVITYSASLHLEVRLNDTLDEALRLIDQIYEVEESYPEIRDIRERIKDKNIEIREIERKISSISFVLVIGNDHIEVFCERWIPKHGPRQYDIRIVDRDIGAHVFID